jgi:hypothetical protein
MIRNIASVSILLAVSTWLGFAADALAQRKTTRNSPYIPSDLRPTETRLAVTQWMRANSISVDELDRCGGGGPAEPTKRFAPKAVRPG